MHRILVVLFAVTFATPAFAQDKHPFTFEDMMKLKRVEEPVPSPDGKWVLFAAVDVDLAANTKTPHIWIVPTSGGQEREIITGQDADRPRWSPDGKSFAFVSTKEMGSQIWTAQFESETGTVKGWGRLTSMPTEASGETWSPDGKSILFVSDVYPECNGAPASEIVCNARQLEERDQSKVKALVFDRLLYRHWNAFKLDRRSHLFLMNFPVSRVSNGMAYLVKPASDPLDLTPGDFDAPPFSLGGQDNYTFSPDGQEICYTSNHDQVEATSTNNDLWIVPTHFKPAQFHSDVSPEQILEKTKNITVDNPASDSTPLYSPDGKYIAYRAQQRPGYESDRFRLMIYDRKTGKKRNLTEDFDRWVGTFVWNLDSPGILFSAENLGEAPIYMVGLDGKRPEAMIGGSNDGLSVVPNDGRLLFTRMSISSPNEIYQTVFSGRPDCPIDRPSRPLTDYSVARCDTFSEEPLTYVNSASQISMSPLEPFWFTGAHNDKVEGFLVRPPNFDPNQKYPLKFIIHGGPEVPMGDQWSYRWNHELFAANGYVVVFINFHGSPGYGQKFIDAINGDWGGAPFEDLMKGLDYAEQHYSFIDKDRECALGASYGGYMVDWMMGHTDRFKCLVSHDGQFNTTSTWGTTEELWFQEWEFKGTPYDNRAMYDKWSPHLSAANFKTPTLVIHSQKDYRLDVSEGFQLFTTLQRRGIPSKMLYFPDEGHWVLKPQNSQLWYKTVNDWVDQWLKK